MNRIQTYGYGTKDAAVIMRCCKVLLSVFLCFGFLFCCGQDEPELRPAKLLYPKNEGEKWKGNNAYDFKWLKGKISYLCPVEGAASNSKYMRSFARVTKAEGEAVIATRENYVRRTCLSVSYNVDWVDWPSDAKKNEVINNESNINSDYPSIVYAYSTGDQYNGYDVRYWVDDGLDNDQTQYDDKIKPMLVGEAFQLFQIGTDVFKLRSVDVSGWDFSEVTSIQQFFSGCTTLTSVNFGTADLQNVTNIAEMFKNCNNMGTDMFRSIVGSWLVDENKLTSRNAEAVKFKGITVTTSNSVQYEISSKGVFDKPIGGSTDLVVRNMDAVQSHSDIILSFDVLFESNGDVDHYVIQYLDGDKDWVENSGEIADIVTINPTAAVSNLKSYSSTYTPASPETFGGNKQFRIKTIKTNGDELCSDPFMLAFDDSMLNFPNSYTIKKRVNGGELVEHVLNVDQYGNIGLPMNSNENIEYIVPEGMEILCNNFSVSTSSPDHSQSKFINKGTIIAAEDIRLSSSKGDGISYDCNGVYAAQNITFRGRIPDIKGVFNIANRFVTESNGQGQDITIASCATIHAYEGNFQHSGGAMKLYIDGEMTVERLIEGNMIHVREGGMLVVGETDFDPMLKIVSYVGSLLTLCYNPTSGVDNLGFCAGTVFFNDNEEEHGWTSDPELEGDINEGNVGNHSTEYWTASGIVGKNPIQAEKLLAAFHSYSECIDPKNTRVLEIPDDPFLPKDKEIQPLYNKNCCSDEFSGSKIQIRELGNKWFRLINGQLIYCENDNPQR